MKEKEVTVSASSVENAIHEALITLGLTHDQASIEILEEPKKAWLGLIGGRPAVVRVVEKRHPLDQTKAYLFDVMEKMGIKVAVTLHNAETRQPIFELDGENIALVIGKRGQTLNALQTLVNLYANQLSDQTFHILLDAEGYRARREDSLKILANRLATKVVKTKWPVKLEPMPSYERKVIHAELQNNPNIKTISAGEDPHRYVRIELKSNTRN